MEKIKKLIEKSMDMHLPREKVDEVVDVMISYLYHLDKCYIKKMYMELDVAINGWKLDREQAEHYVSKMENKDGTEGQHWSYEQVEQYIKSKGMDLSKYEFSMCDLYWAMNMVYSDNYGIVEKMTSDVNKITDFYAELALNFLDDDDAPRLGKAKRYIYAMKD